MSTTKLNHLNAYSSPRFYEHRRSSPTVTRRTPVPRKSCDGRFCNIGSSISETSSESSSSSRYGSVQSFRPRGYTMPSLQPLPSPCIDEEGPYRLRSNSCSSRESGVGVGAVAPNGGQRKRSLVSDPRWRPDSWSNYSKTNLRKLSLTASEELFSPDEAYSKSFRVLVLGAESVGKSSLLEHLNGVDGVHKLYTNNQSETKFLFQMEETNVDVTFKVGTFFESINSLENLGETRFDAVLVIYSTTDRRSFEVSGQMLTMTTFDYKRSNPNLSVCLIANKSDLVRARVVDKEEGKSLANRFEVDFEEVSIELEDNFEATLGWITNRIKRRLGIPLEPELSPHSVKKGDKFAARAKGFVRKILQKRNIKVRSCDSLHVI